MNAERGFTQGDQAWFARLSGDANPLHLDPRFAAATFPGRVVAHGAHAVLWALDRTLSDRPQVALVGVDARFLKPVLVGDRVELLSAPDGGPSSIAVEGDAVMLLRTTAAGVSATAPAPGECGWSPGAPVRDLPPERLPGRAGTVELPAEASTLAAAFPHLAANVGAAGVQGLAAVSTLVGMACPGLHGMLSGFALAFAGPDTPRLAFQVRRFDRASSLVEMDVAGFGLAGTVSAFAGRRDAPADAAAVAQLVAPGEFAGQTPLVIGATSGLGAATARLLAAGGARPVLGWRPGSEAAARALAQTIEAAGGACDLVRFDVTQASDGAEALAGLGWSGGQAYYFASPRIFRRRLHAFQSQDLRDFLEIYADGFYETVRRLLALRGGAPLSVFYPSSVAIDDASPALVEYAAAKGVGERIAAALAGGYPSLSVVAARLPRIQTRQTRSALKLRAQPPEVAMAPYVRQLQAGRSGERA